MSTLDVAGLVGNKSTPRNCRADNIELQKGNGICRRLDDLDSADERLLDDIHALDRNIPIIVVDAREVELQRSILADFSAYIEILTHRPAVDLDIEGSLAACGEVRFRVHC